jgi:hypothetical protein
MLIRRLSAAALCAASVCAGSDERARIVRAVKAPLTAFIARDASALCGAFTPSVASRLAAGNSNCQTATRAIFNSLSSSIELYRPDERPNGLKMSAITSDGHFAQATTTWPWPDIHRTVHLRLERSGGRWLISSTTRLVKFITCYATVEIPCLPSYGIEFGRGSTTVRLPSPEQQSGTRPRTAPGSTMPHASPHYELAFSPPVTGGSLGWCVDYRTSSESSAACPETTSAVSPILEPGWSSSAPPPVTRGFMLTANAVAAISVNGSPAIPTRASAAVPDGLRAVLVEFASPDRRLFDHPPQVVALDTAGDPIKRSEPPLISPNHGLEGVFWQRPSRPPRGACLLSPNRLPGLTPEWGHVVPNIRSFTGLLPPALVSCIDTEYYLGKWPLDAAVVLNAADPGARPEQLYKFKRVPGHPGVFETGGWTGQVARRVRGAWIVVEGGSGLQQRITVLQHLRASINI